MEKIYTPHVLKDGVQLLRADGCTPRAVNWLWEHWLPLEAITILAGSPGAGKTTLALAVAAIISKSGLWPDKTVCLDSHNVIIWSGEDDIETTLLPRLIALGADLSRVHFVSKVGNRGRVREFDPSSDMNKLSDKISEIGGAGLIVIDPIVSVISGDMNQANIVRDGLQTVQNMAKSGASVLGITHFSKSGKNNRSPLERVIGSQAFSALARVVWVAAKDSENRRVVARAKNNLGPDGGGFEYFVNSKIISQNIESSFVKWGDYLEGDSESIMDGLEQKDPHQGSRLNDAKTFLCGILAAEGSMSANSILDRAKQEGHSFSTVNRAKKELGIRAEKMGNGGWSWRL